MAIACLGNLQIIVHHFIQNFLVLTLSLLTSSIGPLLCLPLFIRSFDDDSIPIYMGYLYAIIVVLGPGIYTVIYNLTYFALQRVGMRVRIALCSIIYKKVYHDTLQYLEKYEDLWYNM